MERLATMDKDAYVAQMQGACRRIMEQIADVINQAPSGNLISGSEMEVRDLMAHLRQKAFELGVQMRIDSTEASFSPSAGPGGETAGQQGANEPQRVDGQRAGPLRAAAVGRRRKGQRLSGGRPGG